MDCSQHAFADLIAPSQSNTGTEPVSQTQTHTLTYTHAALPYKERARGNQAGLKQGVLFSSLPFFSLHFFLPFLQVHWQLSPPFSIFMLSFSPIYPLQVAVLSPLFTISYFVLLPSQKLSVSFSRKTVHAQFFWKALSVSFKHFLSSLALLRSTH